DEEIRQQVEKQTRDMVRFLQGKGFNVTDGSKEKPPETEADQEAAALAKKAAAARNVSNIQKRQQELEKKMAEERERLYADSNAQRLANPGLHVKTSINRPADPEEAE
ncbi:unnamed protein product, partial [Amoebophrya sp. A25]